MADFDRDALRKLVAETVLGTDFRRATFGGVARDAPSPWHRVVVRAVEVRGEPHLQFSFFDGKKDVTKNYRPGEADAALAEILAFGFSGIHLATTAEEVDVRTT